MLGYVNYIKFKDLVEDVSYEKLLEKYKIIWIKMEDLKTIN